MKFQKTLLVVGSTLLAASMTACGGNNNSVPETPDDILDTSTVINDLQMAGDEIDYGEDGINIKLWSIVTKPDDSALEKLITKFNEEHLGSIHIEVKSIGHYDYYTTLKNTWQQDPSSRPDMCLMHNEKTIEYARLGYLYPLDSFFEPTGVDFDFTQVYENIDRVTHYKDHRFAIPLDAHGFLTSFRQDIIKKNNLGFDNNTRFIPESRAEYQTLLEGARKLADEGNLWVRNINKLDYPVSGHAHEWYKLSTTEAQSFFPSFPQSTDPDGLSSLYANGGTLTNEDQTKITFQENKGFQTYLTDQVDRYNAKLIGESGTNLEMFGTGNTLMFSEGPWWVGQQYTSQFNSAELKQTEVERAGKKYSTGITAEDAADPVYNSPYVASHPKGWWTLDENKNSETAQKWYGNGHAISITRNVTSMTKVAGALTFINWLTQGKDFDDPNTYNLTNWTVAGHLPAWKNVYNSDTYKTVANKSVVLTALGDPADIIAMEGLEYETTIFDGLAGAVGQVQAAVKTSTGCTTSRAIQILQEVASSTQAALDLLKL